MDVVFARTRHEYGSYVDFWRVVELAGYETRYIDEIDWQQQIVVIGTPKNGEWDGIPTDKRARFIWWNIERSREGDPPMDMSSPHRPAYVDEVWASDRAMARRIGAKYVFLGSHPAFGSADFRHKDYEIVTLMAPLGRRYKLFGELSRFSGDAIGGGWGQERHERLMRSKLMVMCHQDDLPWCEPPRMMIGGSYALPMLCETAEDSGYWVSGVHYECAPYDRLADKARFLLDDPVRLARLGAAAWRLTCSERPFKQEVEAAL